MRVAVLLISILLMFVVGFQSCFVSCHATSSGDEQLSSGSSMGMMVALLYLMGSIFIINSPRVSLAVYALAALLGLVAGATTDYSDMWVWGGLSLMLAGMSHLGEKELKKKGQTK